MSVVSEMSVFLKKGVYAFNAELLDGSFDGKLMGLPFYMLYACHFQAPFFVA